jgi:hypothetical protein
MTIRVITGSLLVFVFAVNSGCRARIDSDQRRSNRGATDSENQTPDEVNDAPTEQEPNAEVAPSRPDPASDTIHKDSIPQNGEISSGIVQKTSGNVLSGRTNTGTVTVITRTTSYLRHMGGAFTQLYDLHSDNFAVGTVGGNGTFAYVVYLNSTIGYVNPASMTLMYCEPQMVSQSADVVAILDCMDALPISKISRTSKYGNGNAVFSATGELLYEDGSKAYDLTKWMSVNGRTMYVNALPSYGNGTKMRDLLGNVFFSNNTKAYDIATNELKFADATLFASRTRYMYKGGVVLADVPTTGLSASYYYQATPAAKLLTWARGASNLPRTTEVFYKNGTRALNGAKTFRADGSEAPVEVYGSDETAQSSLIWSASQLYTSMSISQFSKEATFNVVDENASDTISNAEMPPNPTDLSITAPILGSLAVQWKSAGGSTASFVYKVLTGTVAPADCSDGTDVGGATTVTFSNLLPATKYSVRVCSRNVNGTMSAGVTITGTTLAAPPPPPPNCTTIEAETSPYHLVGAREATVWAARVTPHRAGYMLYGPYTPATIAGKAEARFNMSIVGRNLAPNVKVVTIDVHSQGRVLGTKDVSRTDFTADKVAQEFVLPYVGVANRAPIEFRVFWHDRSDILIDKVRFGPVGECTR